MTMHKLLYWTDTNDITEQKTIPGLPRKWMIRIISLPKVFLTWRISIRIIRWTNMKDIISTAYRYVPIAWRWGKTVLPISGRQPSGSEMVKKEKLCGINLKSLCLVLKRKWDLFRILRRYVLSACLWRVLSVKHICVLPRWNWFGVNGERITMLWIWKEMLRLRVRWIYRW